jgi:hypothetical protein
VSAFFDRLGSSRGRTLKEHLRRVAEQHLADGFVVGVARLDLLGDGVDVAEAALEGAAGEDRIDAGGLVDGVADCDGSGDRMGARGPRPGGPRRRKTAWGITGAEACLG